MFTIFKNDLKLLLRYTQLFPLCFAVFVSMLGFGLVMPLLPIYARSFGATGIQLGLLTTSFAITRAVTTYPGGWLADKSGRKKPVTAGLLMYSVVMVLYGFTEDVNQLILLRALQGVASGIVWPIINTMVVDIVPPEDRGKALGLYEMMWFLGMAVGPGLGGVLAGLYTIAFPFFVCGALAFLSMVLVVLTVKETITLTKAQDSLATSKDAFATVSVKGLKQFTPFPLMFLSLCVARFTTAFSNSLIQPVLSVYANEILGIPTAEVGVLFTVMGMVTLIATLPMGTVADNIGRKPTFLFGGFLYAFSALLIIFSGGFWPLLVIMMLQGFARAIINPSLIAMFSGVASPFQRGKAMGIFNAFQNVGLVVGSSVGGFLYEFSSSETPFIACFIVGLIGVLVVLFAVSEPKNHQSLNA
ncbi:MAG: MFS transporter [Candidatus Bathyarchaeota archaeon]|nr:MFS transporter [Candidatus Bathyarchaeota archaeon]